MTNLKQKIEKLLIEYKNNNDIEIRNKIVILNKGLVIKIVSFFVKKHNLNNDIFNDMISCGHIGLIKGIDLYVKLSPHCSFSTYCFFRIFAEINLENKKYFLVHIPNNKQNLKNKLKSKLDNKNIKFTAFQKRELKNLSTKNINNLLNTSLTPQNIDTCYKLFDKKPQQMFNKRETSLDINKLLNKTLDKLLQEKKITKLNIKYFKARFFNDTGEIMKYRTIVKQSNAKCWQTIETHCRKVTDLLKQDNALKKYWKNV